MRRRTIRLYRSQLRNIIREAISDHGRPVSRNMRRRLFEDDDGGDDEGDEEDDVGADDMDGPGREATDAEDAAEKAARSNPDGSTGPQDMR